MIVIIYLIGVVLTYVTIRIHSGQSPNYAQFVIRFIFSLLSWLVFTIFIIFVLFEIFKYKYGNIKPPKWL